MNKTLNSIGWKYALMGLAYIVMQYAIIIPLKFLLPDFTEQYGIYISLGLTVFVVDLICFPLIFLLTLKMPKAQIEKKSMNFGHFLLCVLMMYGLVGVGAIIGSAIHLPLTLPFSHDGSDSEIVELLLGSNVFLRILVAGILAPIFEELIFRKVLIDHLAPKGELIAILASGLMFGLFHGNFQQGFFAAFIGCLFAFIYLRTGRVIYTILLHMVLNCATSAVTVELLKWMYKVMDESANVMLEGMSRQEMALYLENNPEVMGSTVAMMIPMMLLLAWCGILFLLGIVGLVLFIVFLALKKFKLNRIEGDDSFGKQALSLLKTPCMWLFYIICAFLFASTYLPDIIISVVGWIKG